MSMPGRAFLDWRRAGLLWPAALLIVGFCVSLAGLFTASLREGSHAPTLTHYVTVVSDPLYRDYLVVTLRIALITVGLGLLLGVPFAFWIAKTKRRWLRAFLIMSVTVPFLTGMIVRLYALTIILGNTGLINEFLRWIGVVPANDFFPLLRHETGVVIGTTAFALPFMIFLLVGSFRRMDDTLEEAAASLGANEITTLFRVTLPLLLPGIVAAASLGFVLASVAFSSPLVLGGGSVNMVANAIYSEAMQSLNAGRAATLAVLSLVVTGAVLAAARKIQPSRA
jgi:ABC-type spermidine/putrescine transport system permease subunit I